LILSARLRLAVEDQRVGCQNLPAHQLLGEPLDRGVVHDRERTQILGADRQHLVAVVATLALDRRGEPDERPGLLGRDGLQALEVQHDLRQTGAGGHLRVFLGQQLADRHAVELGQLGQALH
jgi:hypothetical protein